MTRARAKRVYLCKLGLQLCVALFCVPEGVPGMLAHLVRVFGPLPLIQLLHFQRGDASGCGRHLAVGQCFAHLVHAPDVTCCFPPRVKRNA